MGNGSYDILCNLNLLCLTHGKKVLGPCAAIHRLHRSCQLQRVGVRVLLPRPDAQLSVRCSCLYRPDVRSIRHVHCRKPQQPNRTDHPAAGNSGKSRSALGSWTGFWSLTRRMRSICRSPTPPFIWSGSSRRSLSPGAFPRAGEWPVCGLGYAAASTESDLLPQLKKLVLPFNSNGIARVLAQTALQTRLENPDDPFGIRAVRASKRELCEAIAQYNLRYSTNLQIAQTYADTPILIAVLQRACRLPPAAAPNAGRDSDR